MKYKYSKLIPGLIFLLICLGIFLYRISSIEKKYDDILIEYPHIKLTDSLNNIVIDKYSPQDFKYTPTVAFVKLDNDSKFRLYSSLNALYDNKGINDILNKKDKVYKNIGSDTIYIIKSQSFKKYFFIIKSHK